MNLRKIGATLVAAAAVAISPAVAHAEPVYPPPPRPAVDEAQETLVDALLRDGYDLMYANEFARRILGQYLP